MDEIKRETIKTYGETAYSLINKAIHGKYLQNINKPSIVVRVAREPIISLSREVFPGRLVVWDFNHEKHTYIPMEELVHYAVISEKQAKEYLNTDLNRLEEIILIHKDSPAAKIKIG